MKLFVAVGAIATPTLAGECASACTAEVLQSNIVNTGTRFVCLTAGQKIVEVEKNLHFLINLIPKHKQRVMQKEKAYLKSIVKIIACIYIN